MSRPALSSSAGSLPGDPPGGRRALAVWGVGVSVYFVAVIFRTSLGVVGLDAADRFQVGASALSTFSILQLLVYAGMQIPVGLLVDRLGTKKVLTLGILLFTASTRSASRCRRRTARRWRRGRCWAAATR